MSQKKAEKHDQGKLRLSLVPPHGLAHVAEVMQFGEKKYAAHNFIQEGGLGMTRCVEAAMRHILSHQQGETMDPESGLMHLAHAAASLLMGLEHKSIYGMTGDERPQLYLDRHDQPK